MTRGPAPIQREWFVSGKHRIAHLGYVVGRANERAVYAAICGRVIQPVDVPVNRANSTCTACESRKPKN